MKPRVLLVEPPYGEPKMEPNGLLYLATFARASDFHVDVIYQSPKRRLTVEQVIERALVGDYSVVGATAMTPTLPRALAILRGVKAGRPAVTTVLGGYHATVAHDRLLRRHLEVDVAVRGEGELTFLELLQRLQAEQSLEGVLGLSYRDGARVVVNELRPQMRDLDALPFPDRTLGPGPEEFVHLFDLDSRKSVPRVNVTSSRGCPYGCGFCVLGSDDPRSPISMRQWRARSPENVVDEIGTILANHQVGGVIFAEDNFTVSPRRLEAFADLVLDRGLQFAFTFDSRANQICRLEDVMPKLKRAGLATVEIGIESGSQAVLDRFAKGTKVAHNTNALRILAENGIHPRIDFIMFDPETTVHDLEQNLTFLRDHAPPAYDHNRTVYHKLELHPGTALQREYLARGWVHGEPDEIIPYEFAVPEVAAIYQVLDRFYWDHQSRLNDLKKRLHFLQVALAGQGQQDALKRLAKELVFVVYPLNALPLKLFAAVLAGAGEPASALSRRVRPFEQRVDECEREFQTIVATQNLTGLARDAYQAAIV